MGVSKNRGNPPKWMVYNGKNPIKMDDLGEKPTIFGSTPIYLILIMDLNLGANFTDPKRGPKKNSWSIRQGAATVVFGLSRCPPRNRQSLKVKGYRLQNK